MNAHSEIIDRYWYSVDWDVQAMWQLRPPESALPISALEWHLDVPVWPDVSGNGTQVTPRQILLNPASHPEEMERIEAASLTLPLDVDRHRSRILILDGIHRRAKYYRLGLESIPVRRVPDTAVFPLSRP